MRNATISDVSAEAGVSISIVSRVLTGRGSVSQEKRLRVQQAVQKLNYHPSSVARALRERRTRTLGLLCSWYQWQSLARDYYVHEVLSGLWSACGQANYQVLITNFSGRLDRQEEAEECGRILSDTKAEGVILLGPPVLLVESLKRAPFDVVLLFRRDPGFAFIDSDDAAGMKLLVEKLADKGQRRIGLLGGNLEFDASAGRRYQAFEEAMRARSLYDPSLVWKGSMTGESGEEGARALLAAKDPAGALIAMNDDQAAGAWRAIQELPKARRPALLSFDDRPVARELGISTLHQPFFEMGERAGRYLIERAEGRKPAPLAEVLPLSLVERGSA